MAAGTEFRMGDTLSGRYLIESKVGESPAAAIYLGNENHSTQKVCLKVYRQEVSADLLNASDFFLKASVRTTLVHDGLCQVFDICEHEGLVVVAREFVEGESFEAFCQRNNSQGQGYSQGMQVLWQVAQALGFMHESMRHLRIHPGNLILGTLGAKLVDSDPRALPLSDLIPDTLHTRPEYRGFIAPEARGKGFVAYPTSDLFSLSGLLFRLVTGQNPLEDIRANHRTLQNQRVAREIEDFLVKGMHPKAEDRFGSADSFSEALWQLQPYLDRMQGQTHSGTAQVASPAAQWLQPEPEPVITPVVIPPMPEVPLDFGSPTTSPFATGKHDAYVPSGANDPFAVPFSSPTKEPTFFGSPTGQDRFQTPPAKGSDTLFGSAPMPSGKAQTDFFAPPESSRVPTDFGSPQPFSAPPLFQPVTPARSMPPPPPPQPFQPYVPSPASSRPAYTPPPPPPPPPVGKMSTLENDSSDLTLSGSDTGMTQFGFKGASDGDRTGDYRQEGIRKKRRLTLVIGIVSALGVVVLLVVLYFVLRATAPQPKLAQGDILAETAPLTQPMVEDPPPLVNDPSQGNPPKGSNDAPPFPETGASGLGYEDAFADAPTGRPSEALAPVKPPTFTQREDVRPEPATSSSPLDIPNPSHSLNPKVSPGRRAAIITAFKAHEYPGSAAERIQMADDFNDIAKVAEANVCYQKALEVSNITTREKTLALGGLAVTYKNMGMKSDALRAVEKLLEINPRNRFALGLKAELQ